MDKLQGPINCLALGTFSWCVNLIAMSFIRNQWWAVVPQLTLVFGEALFRVAFVTVMVEISPLPVYNTMFAIAGLLYHSLAATLCNFLGSVLVQRFNVPVVFQGACALGCHLI